MKEFTIYSRDNCPFCTMAKNLIERNGLKYTEVNIFEEENLQKLEEKLGYAPKTVPQIFESDNHIGGYNDLLVYFSNKG